MSNENKTEYIIVRDENGKPIGKRKVTSKKLMENVFGYKLNNSVIIPIGQHKKDQELADDLPELEESYDE